MGSNDFVTLFFLVAAVVIFWQLRSVLGRRTGNEKPPVDPLAGRTGAAPSAEDARVVTLPRRDEADGEDRVTVIDAYTPVGTPLNQQLRRIVDTDPTFTPKDSSTARRMAYEMIVTAFAAWRSQNAEGPIVARGL